MSLNSFNFVFFLCILLVVMSILQLFRRITSFKNVDRVQLIVLLAFSYAFVFFNNWKYCICLLVITIITYLAGISINTIQDSRKKYVVIGVNSILILFLGYFKYTNFFFGSISGFFGMEYTLFKIILPIGISFYVFSAISYILDVYWNRYEVEKNFVNVALYISFFPKLTAGPIVRGKTFFSQLKQYKGVELLRFSEGIQIFVFGLFKKIVLADRLGVFVNDVFYAPTAYNTGTVILAVISYSLQIYFDFSGYSDMAIGVADILGFDFEPNFNLPYVSQNMSEFWKRWHISLSSWFHEYLYIPLGGNRKGMYRTYINLLVVMLVSGLWHGAGMTFVLWGFMHGVVNCLTHRLKKRKYISNTKLIGWLGRILINFTVVTLLWVVFRASDMTNALFIYKGIFTIHSGINQPYVWSFIAITILIISTIVACVRSKKYNEIKGFYPVMDLSKFYALVLFFVFGGLTILLGYYGNTAFIYGAF